jgi:hypothetical protein
VLRILEELTNLGRRIKKKSYREKEIRFSSSKLEQDRRKASNQRMGLSTETKTIPPK